MSEADGMGPWCRWCDEHVRREGLDAVHAETGDITCADGKRVAVSTLVPPSMRAEAREIAAEFGHRWMISTASGVFYAIPKGATGTHVHVDASTSTQLRTRLRIQEQINVYAAADAARRDAAQEAHTRDRGGRAASQ